MLQMQGRKGAQAPPSDAGKEDLALFGGEVLAFGDSPKPKLHRSEKPVHPESRVGKPSQKANPDKIYDVFHVFS